MASLVGRGRATTSPSFAMAKKCPKSVTSCKDKLIPLGVLDEFKSAVFVNWWRQIRYFR